MVDRRSFAALLVLLTSASAQAETYYVDYEAGSDGNEGTTTTTAWKHCPAMEPFSGSYSHEVGDRFIFRGGVTWPNAALPLRIEVGGEPDNADYYGVDETWFTGSSWTRPVFDGEGIEFGNHGGNRGNVIHLVNDGASDVTIEGIEIHSFVWTDPAPTSPNDGWAIVADGADDVTIRNVYAHDWIVRTTKDGKFGGFGVANQATGLQVLDSIVAAPPVVDEPYRQDPVGQTSGCGVCGAALVDGCEVTGTTQGVFSCVTVRNSVIHDVADSYDPEAHENGAWVQNNGTFESNILANTGEGVAMYVLPGWGGRSPCTTKIYNNVFYNLVHVGGGNPINLSPQGNPDETNRILFLNNVVVAGTALFLGTTKAGEPFQELVVQNNLFVSDKKYSNPDDVMRILDEADMPNFINSHNVVLTGDEAAAEGLSEAERYEPLSEVVVLVDQGVAHTDLFDDDLRGAPRSETWDVGAYEYDPSWPPSDGGTGGMGGAGGSGAGTPPASGGAGAIPAGTDGTVDEGGCDCRLAAGRTADTPWAIWLLGLAIPLAGWRRRSGAGPWLALLAGLVLATTSGCSDDETTPGGGTGGSGGMAGGGAGGSAGSGGVGAGGDGGAGGTVAPSGLTREGRWFQIDGEYRFLVGYDYQSLAVRTDLDYLSALDHFQTYRINKVRLWLYPWFMGENALSPWAYADGLHDLDEWNPAYWQRMHDFLEAAASREIIVELTLFAPNWVRSAQQWASDTFRLAYNETFNENGAFAANGQGHFYPEFFELDGTATTTSGQTIEDVQQALVDKAVAELATHRNVYFEICNEFPIVFNQSLDAIHTHYPWQVHWADHVDGATERLVTVHAHQGSGAHTKGIEHFWDEPSVDVLNFHFYSGDPAAIATLLHDAQSKGKVLQQNESFDHRAELDAATRETWALFTSGGYGFFYGRDEDIALIGDAEWQQGATRLQALRDIAESVSFESMSPVDDQGSEYDGLVSQGPAGANWQVLAQPGSEYLVYLWGSKSTTPLHIDLPAGSYTYEWLDPRSGDSLGTGSVAGGDDAEIAAPPTADWAATAGLVLVVRA